MVNKAILVGRVGKDPELRYTQSGKAVANLSVATSFRFNNKETTEWHRVTAWGKTAEIVGEYIRKGRLVYVEGRIQTTKYTDKAGYERHSTDIVADNIHMLDSPKGSPEAATTTAAGDEEQYRDQDGDGSTVPF